MLEKKMLCERKQFYCLIAAERKMYKWTLSADDSALRKHKSCDQTGATNMGKCVHKIKL